MSSRGAFRFPFRGHRPVPSSCVPRLCGPTLLDPLFALSPPVLRLWSHFFPLRDLGEGPFRVPPVVFGVPFGFVGTLGLAPFGPCTTRVPRFLGFSLTAAPFFWVSQSAFCPSVVGKRGRHLCPFCVSLLPFFHVFVVFSICCYMSSFPIFAVSCCPFMARRLLLCMTPYPTGAIGFITLSE